MKSGVAIALIIAGVVLIAMPPVSDYFWRADALRLVRMTGLSSGTLDGKMEERYRIGCYVAGAAAMGIAILCSIPRPRRKSSKWDERLA